MLSFQREKYEISIGKQVKVNIICLFMANYGFAKI